MRNALIKRSKRALRRSLVERGLSIGILLCEDQFKDEDALLMLFEAVPGRYAYVWWVSIEWGWLTPLEDHLRGLITVSPRSANVALSSFQFTMRTL